MWTSEQQAAIALRHANLLVSAAAGSGKTAVLVERVIQLILSGETEVDKLLVVTYTNAAAGEMRERIEKAVTEAIENKRGDVRMLSEQLKKLNRSSIKTFHAFCLDVIRSHFQLIDIDPSFRMINDSEKMIMVEEALDSVFEKAYEVLEPDFVTLVEAFSGNRNDVKLRQMVLQLYGFILAHPDPLNFLEMQWAIYEEASHPVRQEWSDILLNHFRELIDNGLEHIEAAIDICHTPGGPTPYIKTLQSDHEKLVGLKEASEIGLKALSLSVGSLKFDRIATIKKDEKDLYSEALIAKVKDFTRDKVVKKQVVEVIKNFFAYKSLEQFEEEIVLQAPIVKALAKLTGSFYEVFSAQKRENNLMDFSDLEHFAVAVLKHEKVCALYKDQFDYIFVDEYQDASAIQEYIVNAIKRKGNVFMVGDVKQSIYKFRLADPTLFLQKYKTFTHVDTLIKGLKVEPLAFHKVNEHLKQCEEEQFVRIDLRSNFRSRPSVLDDVNGIFENIMSETIGDVAYDAAAKLYGKMHFEETESPYVEAMVISKKDLTDEETDHLELIKSDEIEARVVAGKIKKLIGSPIYFPKTQSTKRCRYKDITLLLRSTRSWSATLEQVFIDEGIPLYAESQTGYFDTLEIKWLMAMLKAIDNPLDDEAFLTVLHSPLFRIDLNDLALVKAITPEIPFYYYKISDERVKSEVSDNTHRLFGDIVDKFEKWRYYTTYKPLEDVLWAVVNETRFLAYVSSMPGGISRMANVELLIERAGALRKSNFFSLSHFIEFIEQMIAADGDMGIAKSAGEQDDVVKLMSIHKSKGLEFPVVFVMGLGRKFNQMDTSGDIMLHKALGLAMPYVDLELRTKTKSLAQFALKEKIKRETLSEEMRVLYVGLTRAVDRLFLVATVADAAKKQVLWEEEMSVHRRHHSEGFADWVIPNLDPSVVTVYEPKDIVLDEVKAQNSYKAQVALLEEKATACSAETLMWLNERLKFNIDHELQLKPLKVSVSDLKKSESLELVWQRPVFLEEQVVQKAMTRGTAIHKVFERIDFVSIHTIQEAKTHLEQLLKNQYIDEETYQMFNIYKFMAFINSELGIRLKRAKQIYRETPFVFLEDGQFIQGIIDLYFEEEDGLVLVDYKTDGLKGRTLDEVASPYVDQMRYYEKALSTLTGCKVKEKVIYFIDMEAAYKIE